MVKILLELARRVYLSACAREFWGFKELKINVKDPMYICCFKGAGFFFKFWQTHASYFGAIGTPVLDFWWCLLWVSKPEWVLPYSLVFAEVNVMYIPRDPPLVLYLLTSWQLPLQPVTSPHASAEVGLGLDSNGHSPTQKTNVLSLCQRPTFKGVVTYFHIWDLRKLALCEELSESAQCYNLQLLPNLSYREILLAMGYKSFE